MDERIKDVLERFKKLRVAVVGDIMFDRYVVKTKSKRENPENKDIPMFNGVETLYTGAAAYVARIAVSLGAKSDLYGVVGDDLYGKELEKMCRQSGINYFFVHDGKTIVKERHYDVRDNGEPEKYRERVDYSEGQKKISSETQNKIFRELEGRVKGYDVFVLPDYDKRIFTEEFAQRIIRLANSENIPLIVDPKPKNINFFRGCTVVCPNLKEAEEIVGGQHNLNLNDLCSLSLKIQRIVDSKYAIITCGEEGAYVYDRDNCQNSGMIFSETQEKVDVTGAGDVFSATLALGFGHKNSHNSDLTILDLVKLANSAAATVVGKKGTVNVDVEEIKRFLKR